MTTLRMTGVLDRLPAPARHATIAGIAAAGGSLTKTIIDAHGVSTVAWSTALTSAIDSGCTAAAVALTVLVITPLTKQYGLFKGV